MEIDLPDAFDRGSISGEARGAAGQQCWRPLRGLSHAVRGPPHAVRGLSIDAPGPFTRASNRPAPPVERFLRFDLSIDPRASGTHRRAPPLEPRHRHLIHRFKKSIPIRALPKDPLRPSLRKTPFLTFINSHTIPKPKPRIHAFIPFFVGQ